MRKLKLESLQVESFDTTAATPPARGTVQGHGAPGSPQETQVYMCTDTVGADCSEGCTYNTCEGCVLLTEFYCEAP